MACRAPCRRRSGATAVLPSRGSHLGRDIALALPWRPHVGQEQPENLLHGTAIVEQPQRGDAQSFLEDIVLSGMEPGVMPPMSE